MFSEEPCIDGIMRNSPDNLQSRVIMGRQGSAEDELFYTL